MPEPLFGSRMAKDNNGQSRGRVSRRDIIAFAGMGATAGLAGCLGNGNGNGNGDGGGNGNGGDTGGSTPTATSGSGVNTITIGELNPLSGQAGVYGNPMHRGLVLGVEDVGEFEVDGSTYTFQISENDDQCQNSKGINIIRRLIQQENVKFIQGSLCSNVSTATADLVQDANAIQFINSSWSQSITYCNDQIFRNAYTGPQSEPAIVQFIMDEGFEQVTLFGDEKHPSVVDVHPRLKEKLEENDVAVDVMWYERGQEDYSTAIQRINSNDPDFIIHGGYTPDCYSFVKQARELGLSQQILDQSQPAAGAVKEVISDPSIIQDVLAINAPVMQALASDGYGPAEEYVNRVNEQFNNPDTWHVGGSNYDYAFILKTAMQNAGTVEDLQAIREELKNVTIDEALSDTPLGGPAQKYVELDNGRVMDDRGQSFFVSYIRQWEGEFNLEISKEVAPEDVPFYPPIEC